MSWILCLPVMAVVIGVILELYRRDLSRPARKRHALNARLDLVALEDRIVPATINLVDPALDSFKIFSDPNLARQNVAVVIKDLEQIFVSFNRTGDTFDVTIKAEDLPDGVRGKSSITQIVSGVPVAGTITLDINGAGRGWYFDPTPFDNAGFTNVISPFSAINPNSTRVDFMRTVNHEFLHILGLSQGANLKLNNGGLLTAAGTDTLDNGGDSQLYVFRGATTTATLTKSQGDGIHVHEGSTPGDLMNHGRTLSATYLQRQLPSDVNAGILADSYGYTVRLPSTLETFLVNLDPSSHELVISGNPLAPHDAIRIDEINGNFVIAVNNVTATVAVKSVGRIQINGGIGNDTVTVGAVTKPITVNGGDGFDTVIVNDAAGAANTTYVVSASSVKRGRLAELKSSGFENVRVDAGAGNDIFELNSAAANVAYFMNGGAGNDPFVLGKDYNGNTAIDGQDGSDTLDYSVSKTKEIVNLQTRAATRLAGGVSNIENVIGGKGPDELTGSDASNILAGGDGADILKGNGGRDILIGGDGADIIYGGLGDDLMVGGITSFDNAIAALLSIQAEWNSALSYTQRLNHINGTASDRGLNGANYLKVGKNGTVSDDRDGDTFWGEADTDAFFALTTEATPDLTTSERRLG